MRAVFRAFFLEKNFVGNSLLHTFPKEIFVISSGSIDIQRQRRETRLWAARSQLTTLTFLHLRVPNFSPRNANKKYCVRPSLQLELSWSTGIAAYMKWYWLYDNVILLLYHSWKFSYIFHLDCERDHLIFIQNIWKCLKNDNFIDITFYIKCQTSKWYFPKSNASSSIYSVL